MSKPEKRRMRYDATFKLKVVKLAIQTSNVNAARHYCWNEKQVATGRRKKVC